MNSFEVPRCCTKVLVGLPFPFSSEYFNVLRNVRKVALFRMMYVVDWPIVPNT